MEKTVVVFQGKLTASNTCITTVETYRLGLEERERQDNRKG
jgi:hypothetical protein